MGKNYCSSKLNVDDRGLHVKIGPFFYLRIAHEECGIRDRQGHDDTLMTVLDEARRDNDTAAGAMARPRVARRRHHGRGMPR
jgi:hypothetical protein